MKKLSLLIIMIAANIFAQSDSFKKNEILVQFAPDVTAKTFEKNGLNVQIDDAKLISKTMNIWKLTVNTDQLTERQTVNELYKSNQIVTAQLNHLATLRETIPNDESFDQQWQYYQASDIDIDADLAWDITTGGQNTDGDDIVVTVPDSGIDLIVKDGEPDNFHPDLADNVWVNKGEIAGDGIDNDGNGLIDDVYGWDFGLNVNNINHDPGVFSGHGTNVSGMIGAVGNNNIGVTGINWKVKIMTLKSVGLRKFVNGEWVYAEDEIIAMYDYAVQQRIKFNETNGEEGSFVVAINSSWGVDNGKPEDAPLWCAFYDTMGEHGILNTAATANANLNIDETGDLPTACTSEYLIAVTSTNKNDVKATAGYGLETIDLGAPGHGIYTTRKRKLLEDGSADPEDNPYEFTSGTSFASPLVAGTIALLYSAPCSNFTTLSKENPKLAAEKIRDYILEGVDPNPSLEGKTVTGGRLNVNNALQLLMADCEDVLDVSESSLTDLKIYPNPASDVLKIQTKNNQSITNVEIFGMDGKLIKSNLNNNTLDVSQLPSGVYTLKIQINNKTSVVRKFIKK